MNITTQTNDIVRAAIAAVRIERNPVTMGMLYDALRKRRNARDYVMPEKERMAWDYMERNCHYSDLSFREKVEFVKLFAQTGTQSFTVKRLKMHESGLVTKQRSVLETGFIKRA